VNAETTALHVCWRPPAGGSDGDGSWAGASVGWEAFGDDDDGSQAGRFAYFHNPSDPTALGWGRSTAEACARQNVFGGNLSYGETVGCWGAASKDCSALSDGDCDDGGPGSEYHMCEWGSDCEDCGPRDGPDPVQYEWRPVTCGVVAEFWASKDLGGPQLIKSSAASCAAVGDFWRDFPLFGSAFSGGIGASPRASCCAAADTVSAESMTQSTADGGAAL